MVEAGGDKDACASLCETCTNKCFTEMNGLMKTSRAVPKNVYGRSI